MGTAPPPPPPPTPLPEPGAPPPGAFPVAPFAAYAEDATKVYRQGDAEIRALDGITVGFAWHRFTAIMGPSGSGKSTLLQCIAGLDRLTAGEVYLGAQPLSRLPEKQLTVLRRDRMGFVFQAFNLLPSLTAEANIRLPAKLAGRKIDPAWFDEVVRTLGLADRLGFTPRQLSGGQQQRVAVARAVVTRPEIVFADEPTGNLDSATGDEILRLLREAVDHLGQTVVMVTHDPRAAAVADHVVFLADGRLVAELDDPTVEAIIDRQKALGA